MVNLGEGAHPYRTICVRSSRVSRENARAWHRSFFRPPPVDVLHDELRLTNLNRSHFRRDQSALPTPGNCGSRSRVGSGAPVAPTLATVRHSDRACRFPAHGFHEDPSLLALLIILRSLIRSRIDLQLEKTGSAPSNRRASTLAEETPQINFHGSPPLGFSVP